MGDRDVSEHLMHELGTRSVGREESDERVPGIVFHDLSKALKRSRVESKVSYTM
jgi:hypothetical protein